MRGRSSSILGECNAVEEPRNAKLGMGSHSWPNYERTEARKDTRACPARGAGKFLSGLPQPLCFTTSTLSFSNMQKIAYVIRKTAQVVLHSLKARTPENSTVTIPLFPKRKAPVVDP